MFLFKLKLKLLIIMDNFKFNIYLFVNNFWKYLLMPNILEISNIMVKIYFNWLEIVTIWQLARI